MLSDDMNEFEQALLSVDRAAATAILERLANGNRPMELLEQVIVPTLDRIGENWDEGSVALSQVYMSGRICEELVDAIFPPADTERSRKPDVAIATLDDYHLLGKQIVYSVLRASGHQLIDYGRVDLESLIERVREDDIKVVLISVLMYPAALRVKEVRAALPDHVKIIVGGAPFRFDQELWRQVGADGMGRSASDAISLVASFAGENR